jgi:hypothetical protein
MDALNRGRNSLIAASALVLFAILYYSLIFRYGLNLADEGNVGLISQRLMHGEHPFRDVARAAIAERSAKFRAQSAFSPSVPSHDLVPVD